MKPEDISEALGLVDPEYISESAPAAKNKSGKFLKIFIPVAAALAITAMLAVGAYAVAQNVKIGSPDAGYQPGNSESDMDHEKTSDRYVTELDGATDASPSGSAQNEGPGDGHGSEPIMIASYGEYLKFISENELSEKFVSYDDISVLGEFVMLEYRDDNTGAFTLDYYLRDENGFVFDLLIAPVTDRLSGSAAELSLSGMDGDLRTVNAVGHDAWMRVSDADYHYDNRGEIRSIIWRSFPDMYYSISAYSPELDGFNLHNYPADGSDTVISRLLNKDTAEDAAKYLENNVFKR